jgi:polyisoprenoid-binding protein YceI
MNRISTTALTALALLAATPAFAAEYTVQPGLSSVSFTSDATLETITGTSSTPGGAIMTDTAAPGSTTGSITVPVASLRTGVDMRDEHLHSEGWLNATEFPEITFNISSVSVPDGTTLEHGTTVAAQVTGDFTLHGVTQPITVPAEVSYFAIDNPEIAATYGISSDVLRVETTFDVALADYGVAIPGPMQLKVAPTINVTVRVSATEVVAE